MAWSYFEWQYAFPDIFRPTQRLTCKSLVSLRLIKVNVDGEVLEFFISNCRFLVELHVEIAYGFESLRPSCQAIRLRHLEITNCVRFKRLEICSPNLVSYTFSTFSKNYATMALKDVSSLINLSLGARRLRDLSNNLLELSGCLSRLETLTLQTTTMLDDEEMEFPNFPRLKQLVFEINASVGESLLCFTSLINAAPLLHKMVLKMKWDWSSIKRSALRPNKGQKHQCLKVFEAISFSSRGVGAEMALYVLENAASLEQMIINGKVVSRKGFDMLKAKIFRNIVHTA